MADLECRLECGCRIEWDRYWRKWFWHMPVCGHLCTVDHAMVHRAVGAGYAIAASRGLGPWAERWPG